MELNVENRSAQRQVRGETPPMTRIDVTNIMNEALRRVKSGGKRHLLKPESSPSAPARERCGARGLLPGEAPCPGYVSSMPLGSAPSYAPGWPNSINSADICS